MNPDRERERRIVEQGRQQGKSDDFIRQAVIRDRELRGSKSVMPTAAPEQPGFLKSLAMSTGIPRLAANVVKAGQQASDLFGLLKEGPSGNWQQYAGKTNPATPVNMPWLGAVKPVGQEGTTGQRVRDILGESLKLTSTVMPVSSGVAAVGKATLAGKVAQGLKAGVTAGAVGGGLYGAGEGMQKEGATVGSVAGDTIWGATTGALTGGVIGGALPAVSAGVRGTVNMASKTGRTQAAQNTMNRVARINPTDYNKFKKTTGKDTGAYLVERGIYGNDEEIVQKLTDDWMRSKKIVDDAFTEMGGTWRHAPVKDALEMLAEREAKVSTPNVKSHDFDTVQVFLKKYNTEGLTMSEINEVKRLLEKNVKLDYLKPNSMNPEKVTQATNVDNAIRTWQVDMADKLGLQNLRELNKNTQASRMLADSLYKKMTGQSGNNAIGLGDLVLLSGGDVRNIAMAGARKFFGSKSVQSKFAKAISPVKGKSVLPVTRGPITDPTRRLPKPSFIPMGGKVQGDASFARAVPAQNAVPERLMLNAGDTVSPINQGRAIPVMPRPISGDYLGKEVIAGRSTPKPQQTPRTPDQLRMPSATVKQGSLKQSTDLSTGERPGAQKSSSLGTSITDDPAMIQRLTRERGAIGKPSNEFLLNSAKRELAKTPNDPKLKAFVSEMELMQEARKYKTFEEFVNGHGTPVYHGTTETFDTFKDTGKVGLYGPGTYFYTDSLGAKNHAGSGGRIIKAFVDGKFATNAQLDEMAKIAESKGAEAGEKYVQASRMLSQQGYVGVKDYDLVVVFKPESIKTNSQLREIWDKAGGTPAPTKSTKPQYNFPSSKLSTDKLDKKIEQSLTSERGAIGAPSDDWLLNEAKRRVENPRYAKQKAELQGYISRKTGKVTKEVTAENKEEIIAMIDYIRFGDKYDPVMAKMIDRYGKKYGFDSTKKNVDMELENLYTNTKTAPLPGGQG